MNTAIRQPALPRTIFEINNFVGSTPIEIQASTQKYALDSPVVHITQHSGAMSFQHDLTADQCHVMANALIRAAAQATEIYHAAQVSDATESDAISATPETAGAQ